jgi:tripartite-type tricarboxylate transporter receptor subunit TctC
MRVAAAMGALIMPRGLGRRDDAGCAQALESTVAIKQSGKRDTQIMKSAALIVGLISVGLAPAVVYAQGSYPTKVVRLINPVAAGGNQEIVARAIAEQLSRSMGHQFVVESRPGASAIVGTRIVKSAPADGYTLLTI